jgi:hypothetical protein
MTGTTDYPLPTPANENNDPFRKAGTALLELYRLRRQLLAKDKTGYSPDQWDRHHAALKGLDRVISRVLPYL